MKNNRPVTIYDIAQRINVTPSTVSRALNDSYRISVKTKQAVHKAAAELNYRPNNIASILRKGKGKTIGVIVPKINRHFFSGIIESIERELNERGYNLLICQSNESFEKEKQSLQLLMDNRVDGILIAVSADTRSTDHLQSVVRSNIPIVLFDRTINSSQQTSCVVNDNWKGAYDTVSHLVEQGYKRIGHLRGPQSLKLFVDRERGYLDALKSHSLEINPQFVKEAITEESGTQVARELLNLSVPPDALFCSGDYSALGVMNVALELGVKIPEELGIVGFANEPFTNIIRPRLSSVDQGSQMLGKEAVKLLLADIDTSPEERMIQTRSFAPKLIIRDSSFRNIINPS